MNIESMSQINCERRFSGDFIAIGQGKKVLNVVRFDLSFGIAIEALILPWLIPTIFQRTSNQHPQYLTQSLSVLR